MYVDGKLSKGFLLCCFVSIDYRLSFYRCIARNLYNINIKEYIIFQCGNILCIMSFFVYLRNQCGPWRAFYIEWDLVQLQ